MPTEPATAAHLTRRALIATVAYIGLMLGAHGLAHAQSTEACKMERISKDKTVDFPTAYAAADKRAHAWQADAAVVRLAQTSLGPIDAEARSANWYMVWFSPSTRKRVSITIANGMMTCYADADMPGRIPILKSGVYTDVKQLLATASEKGGAKLMQNGALPSVEMSAAGEINGYRGLWYVNYRAKDGASLQVTFDGSTGKFEKGIPN